MTIVALRRIREVASTDADRIGIVLWTYCNSHFLSYLGQSGLSLGYDSCAAAVAIGLNGDYPTYGNAAVPGGFSVLFGSSRLYRKLDPDFNSFGEVSDLQRSNSNLEQHAEQTAIRTAQDRGLPLFMAGGVNHLYVDFRPCDKCDPWLRGLTSQWYVHYWGDSDYVKAQRQAMRKARYGSVTTSTPASLR
jgi:hypothetical protein